MKSSLDLEPVVRYLATGVCPSNIEICIRFKFKCLSLQLA